MIIIKFRDSEPREITPSENAHLVYFLTPENKEIAADRQKQIVSLTGLRWSIYNTPCIVKSINKTKG